MCNEYYLRHPKDQQFYRFLAAWMTYVSVGSQRWWGYGEPPFPKFITVYRVLVNVLAPTMFISQALYVYINFSILSFESKGYVLVMVPVTGYLNMSLLGSKLTPFKTAMQNFMNVLHLCNYRNQDEYVLKLRIKIEKVTRFCCFFICTALVLDGFTWSFATAYVNFKNKDDIANRTKTLETFLYYIIPIEFEYDWKNWIFVHCLNSFMLWNGILIIIFHNWLNFVLVLQVIGHLKLLKHKIKTEFKENFSKQEVKQKLVEVIKYHSFVIRNFKDVQAAFGFNVFFFYSYNLIAGSVILYQLMAGGDTKSTLLYGPMFIAYMGGLIVLAFVLEEIRRQSDDLSGIVYDVNWADMSISNQKLLMLLLMRTQTPLIFTASGGLESGVRPMISILKSTFSYYVILKQTTNM